MLSRFTPLARTVARSATRPAYRGFSTVGETAVTAEDAAKLSGYSEIDYIISEDATVLDAVQKFAAYNIGCLVTTDTDGVYFHSVGHLECRKMISGTNVETFCNSFLSIQET